MLHDDLFVSVLMYGRETLVRREHDRRILIGILSRGVGVWEKWRKVGLLKGYQKGGGTVVGRPQKRWSNSEMLVYRKEWCMTRMNGRSL